MSNSSSAPPRYRDGGGEASERPSAQLLSEARAPTRDDLARERVWRRLEASTAPKRLSFVAPGVAALSALAVAIAVGWLRSHPPRPEPAVVLTSGLVTSAPGLPAHAGEALVAGEVMTTGPSGHAALALSQGMLVLHESSELSIEEVRPTRVVLKAGSFTADARHGPLRASVHEIGVDTALALFSVTEVAGETIVHVASGEVVVSQGFRRWRVMPGEEWRSTAPDAPGRGNVAQQEIALLDGIATGPRAGQLRVEGDSAYAVSLDGLSTGPAPVKVLAEPGTHRVRASAPSNQLEEEAEVRLGEPALVRLPPPAPAPVDKVERQAPPPPVLDPRLAPAPMPREAVVEAPRPAVPGSRSSHHPDSVRPVGQKAAPVLVALVERPLTPSAVPEARVVAPSVSTPLLLDAPAVVPPSPSPAPVPLVAPPPVSRYARALELERSGNPADAAALLTQVAHERTSDSSLALYELGHLHQHALSDLPAARDDFAAYQAQYPNSSLSQEVALSAIEVELAMKARPRALQGLDAYLASYPSSERASEMRFIRANLRREAGDLSGALRDYGDLSGTSLADDALFLSAVCLRQSNDLVGAERILRDYLARFPSGTHRAEVEQGLRDR